MQSPEAGARGIEAKDQALRAHAHVQRLELVVQVRIHVCPAISNRLGMRLPNGPPVRVRAKLREDVRTKPLKHSQQSAQLL